MSRRKKHAEEAHDGSERWLITFADLMTLLFALFIVLFASAEPSGEKFARVAEQISSAFDVGILGGGADQQQSLFDGQGGGLTPSFGQSPEGDFQILSEDVTTKALELGVYDQVQVQLTDDGVVISLSNNLLFGPASATITERATPFLNHLTTTLSELPNDIRVEGHTDSIPPNTDQFPTNWELSTSRATAVLRYQSETAGIAAARMHASGFADTDPAANNDLPAGRAQNRRADVVILYPQNPGETATSRAAEQSAIDRFSAPAELETEG